MTTKGYLRKREDTQLMFRNLRRLNKAGIALSEITVGGDAMQVIDSLACGDCLVALSIAELSPESAQQQALLKRIADNGITFRPLSRIDTTPTIETENFMDRLLRHLGIRLSGHHNRAASSKTRINEELNNRIIRDCLKSYYELEISVETICESARIPPHALYNFLRENDLPSRRDVKAKPKLNPLRSPGFPQNLLHARLPAEK